MAYQIFEIPQLPNVMVQTKVEQDLLKGGDILGGATSIMNTVVEKLAIKNGNWRFVVTQAGHFHNSKRQVHTFTVYQDKEEIGYIRNSWHKNKEAVEISNDRTSKEMERQNGKITTKVDVAIKHAEKYFYPKTNSEHIEVNLRLAKDAVDRQERDLRSKVYHEFENIREGMEKFITDRWEEFTKLYEVKSNYPAIKEMYAQIKSMDASPNNNTTIMLVGSKYIIYKDGNLVEVDELDTETKTKIGMLKLLQTDDFVLNVGVKIKDDLFILM